MDGVAVGVGSDGSGSGFPDGVGAGSGVNEGVGVCGGSSGVGCGLICDDVGCLSGVTLELRAADGAVMTAYEGEVNLDGQRYPFRCDRDSQASASCLPGGSLWLQLPVEDEPTLQLVVTSTSGQSFTGAIDPTYRVDNDVGGPGCRSCTGGIASVTLE